MKLLVKGLLLGGIFGLGILFFSRANAAGCQLTSVVENVGPIVVGQSIPININGQNCASYSVALNLYENNGGTGGQPPTFIRELGTFTFQTANLATTNVSLTTDDYNKAHQDVTGGNPNAQVFFQASANNTTVNSSIVTVGQPTAGSCQLASATWHTNFSAQPIIGSPLHMIVNGAGCAGYAVSFQIYSDDWLQNYAMGSANGTFDSTGTSLDVIWKANNDSDNRPLASRLGNYDFYFWASAGNAKVKSGTIKIPANSQVGCVNCTNVIAPDPCMCADGFSGPRGTFSSCDNVCQSHIGDALTDAAGTCTTCGPGSGGTCGGAGQPACTPIPAGQNQTYSFNITNPLAGGPNNIFDIITIITQWIMYIAIPLAVLWIMWAGFLMLTAGPKPENFKKGRDILTYTVIGLAIIFIGKGFVSLIISVIQLGGTSPTTTQTPTYPGSVGGPPGAPLPNNGGTSTYPGSVGGPPGAPLPNNSAGSGSSGSSSAPQQYQNVLTVSQGTTSGGAVNSPYDVSLFVSNPTDGATYNWAIVDGALPPGTNLVPTTDANSGGISGTPTQTGTYNVTIQAMDIPDKLYGRVDLKLIIQ